MQPFVRTPPGAGPRHLRFHPNGKYLYAINELENSVTRFDFIAEPGILIERQTVSTLPADFDGESKCAQIRITPCGRHLYAPNRGHDTIACFRVDDDGRLAPLGHAPADPVPRAVNVDPSGRFVLAAGLETGRLTTHRIDDASGRLEALGAVEVGDTPMWVAPVRLGR